MILLILIPFLGEEIASTYRWIRIGLPFGFQPSEFAKWIVVIALARYLSDHNLEMNYFSASIVPIIIVLIPASIVLNQPDLGTAIIILVPVLPMLYWIGTRPFHLFLMVAPLVSILTAFHWLSFSIWASISVQSRLSHNRALFTPHRFTTRHRRYVPWCANRLWKHLNDLTCS